MKEWYTNLQERERLIIIAAVVILIPLMLYLVLWEPLSRQVDTLRNNVGAAQAQVAWIQQSSQEAKSLQANSGAPSAKLNVSLISAVETTANQRGIRPQIKRIEPQGNQKISIEIDDASFDKVISWISQLQTEYGASVTQLSASRAERPGRIKARLILKRAS